jgi:hypothetical protein
MPMALFRSNRFLLSGSLLPLALLAGCAVSQKAAAPPALPTLFNTYSYTGYTVYDSSSSEPPTEVRGVGGSLTLRPGGSYEKRLSIVVPSGPVYFNQDGRFTTAGDSIRFAFTDKKGSDVQRGTYRFDPATRHLTITILGYPAGNKGVYELVAAEPTAPAAPPQPR